MSTESPYPGLEGGPCIFLINNPPKKEKEKQHNFN